MGSRRCLSSNQRSFNLNAPTLWKLLINCRRWEACCHKSDWLPVMSEQVRDELGACSAGQRCWGCRGSFSWWFDSEWESKVFWNPPSRGGDLQLESPTFSRQQDNRWTFQTEPPEKLWRFTRIHFPVQICDLINIHRLLLFTPQRLVLIEKFTSYSFSLYTGFHGNKDVSTEEECTRLPLLVEDLLLNSVKRVTNLGKNYISIIYSFLQCNALECLCKFSNQNLNGTLKNNF